MKKEMAAKEAELKREEARPVIELINNELLNSECTGKNVSVGYFENTFVHNFDNATTVGLLLTLVLIFASQIEVILSNPLHIVLIAVPLTVQTVLIFFIAYSASKIFECHMT